jgi:general secretion pathway protein H
MSGMSMRDEKNGFTLLELVLVLLIMGLTAGIVLPRVGAGWKRIEDKEFMQEFVQTIKRARLRAMSSGEVSAFRISGQERAYGVEDPPQKPIPPNVDVYADKLEVDPATHDRMILFFPDGSISGNNVEIVFDQHRSFLIEIHPLLGSVQYYAVDPR